jgi:hypothetical protein
MVRPAPVFVQPAPVVVSQPVVMTERRVVYDRWLPPGIAKKYSGRHHRHWKHRHHDDD